MTSLGLVSSAVALAVFAAVVAAFVMNPGETVGTADTAVVMQWATGQRWLVAWPDCMGKGSPFHTVVENNPLAILQEAEV